MKLKRAVYDLIKNSYSQVPPEAGGIIGRINDTVCAYMHDNSIQSDKSAEYVPDVDVMNECIRQWGKKKVSFCGIIHSHLSGERSLSNGDMDYIEEMFDFNSAINELYFPLVIPKEGMIVYKVIRGRNGLITAEEPIELV